IYRITMALVKEIMGDEINFAYIDLINEESHLLVIGFGTNQEVRDAIKSIFRVSRLSMFTDIDAWLLSESFKKHNGKLIANDSFTFEAVESYLVYHKDLKGFKNIFKEGTK
ncbi:MAG: hypothetical protein ACUVQP_11435, partial [Bacteroidales bacterium]